ncbi:Rrf2 family transcriptional regulator [Luteolibacter pohnpeiensis]|uniref:Rrf2 family transcriptional regulator n=1 Tax=Luteolibacter pohnpeiensis TaxID=454153 RepID=A0A934S886_9BACT|nr:Rrf2 family transcriptional regulator [Luteolibacter pohnpeiensis]MBK1881502.1 Rrf2 family transcriptional regulator [Luteolibacter pohnpeiensis]
MKISQKLEYACRALAQLAKHHDGRTITRLEDLAQREDISANFLVQILNDLRRGGLIESRRGKSGGYLLLHQPDSITLRQIVESVDPSLLQCSVAPVGESGDFVRRAWLHVSEELISTLDKITLESMCRGKEEAMFYI